MYIDLLGFAVCAAIIFFAGKKLSFYGDLLAELTGMGKAWIGFILMSTVTSLPELMVGISSVSIVGSADLAVGNIVGSCAFNLGILSLMDVFTPKNKPLFSQVSQSHILAASFGIILIVLVGLGLYLDDIVISPSMGLISLSFGVIYLLSVRSIYNYQKINPAEEVAEAIEQSPEVTLRSVSLKYAGFALVIIATALVLPYFAENIAVHTGLGESFVGTLFLAVSTSLPEIAISMIAIRTGSADMAVGNLLGSNIFNVFILFFGDIFYTKGLLLKDASDANLISVFAVIIMTAVAIIGFIAPGRSKRIFLAWDTLAILLLYILNMILLYKLS